jgi:dihydrofolate synthase / folylpolyglutamate synthase
MRFEALEDWLQWQEGLHPSAMDLGLERVQRVSDAMAWPVRPFALIIVAGTNGKGSSVAYLDAMYSAAGYRTGTYTSPHLQRYNERIRIGGEEASDAEIMASFARLDAARGETTITYFEYATLAAMDLFHQRGVDLAIMEVGIGGRLDAVNIFDADCALVTTVDIDHRKWLGDDRESIGHQKAGIFRAHTPAVSAEYDPPQSLVKYAQSLRTPLAILGWHYDLHEEPGDTWTFAGQYDSIAHLPRPGLPGQWQLRNAAGALAVLEQLRARLPVPFSAMAAGLLDPGLRGRFQQIHSAPDVFVDVAHNPQAARSLASNLRTQAHSGPTFAVVAMLGDKDLGAALQPLIEEVDGWYVGTTTGSRGLPAASLAQALCEVGGNAPSVFGSATDAFRAAIEVDKNARIVVFGSFHTVGDILALVESPDFVAQHLVVKNSQSSSDIGAGLVSLVTGVTASGVDGDTQAHESQHG